MLQKGGPGWTFYVPDGYTDTKQEITKKLKRFWIFITAVDLSAQVSMVGVWLFWIYDRFLGIRQMEGGLLGLVLFSLFARYAAYAAMWGLHLVSPSHDLRERLKRLKTARLYMLFILLVIPISALEFFWGSWPAYIFAVLVGLWVSSGIGRYIRKHWKRIVEE